MIYLAKCNNLKNFAFYFFVLLFSFGCNPTPSSNQEIKSRSQQIKNQPKDKNSKFKGIIRSTGLSIEDKKLIGLKSGDYQLVTKDKSYFLEGAFDFKKLQGVCIFANGEVVRKSRANAKVYDYDRGTLNLLAFSKISIDQCNCEVTPNKESVIKTASSIYENKEPEKLIGQITRCKRPSPDIAYDYYLKLEKPYTDHQDPSGNPTLVDNLMILPTDFEMLAAFEKHIASKEKLALSGYKLGGYVESTVFHVLSIQ